MPDNPSEIENLRNELDHERARRRGLEHHYLLMQQRLHEAEQARQSVGEAYGAVIREDRERNMPTPSGQTTVRDANLTSEAMYELMKPSMDTRNYIVIEGRMGTLEMERVEQQVSILRENGWTIQKEFIQPMQEAAPWANQPQIFNQYIVSLIKEVRTKESDLWET